jgi:hypothetical protein
MSNPRTVSDVAAVIERLRRASHGRATNLYGEAADKLEQQARQIAERDEVLREARGFITERGKLDLDWDAAAETSDILAKLSALIGNEGVSE